MNIGKLTRQTLDENYSRVSAYMMEKGSRDTAWTTINLLWVISQSEEARDVREFLSGRELPIVETFHDFDASHELIQLGLNKQAFASLRMGLDNGLLAAYWHAVGHDTPEFKRWLASKENTPRKDKDFWRPIYRLREVEAFCETFPLRERIEDVNDQLSNYVHTKGFWHSTMGELQRRMQAQDENVDCDRWYEFFLGATRVVVTLQLLVRPKLAIEIPDAYLLRKFGSYDHIPMCGVLFGEYWGQIRECVGDAEYNEISAIAEGSPEVHQVRRYLDGHPDLTDDEFRKRNWESWKSSGLDECTAKRYSNEALRLVQESFSKEWGLRSRLG